MAIVRLDQWAVRSPEPVGAQTGEGFALLSTDQRQYFVLNDSAAAIWHRLSEPIQLGALAKAIAAEFHIAAAEAGEAVVGVVAQFLEQNIVIVQDAPF